MALSQNEIRRIIQLRGLGYSQQDIADDLGISRRTVENHLGRLRMQAEEAKKSDSLDDLFAGLVLGAVGIALLSKLLGKDQRR